MPTQVEAVLNDLGIVIHTIGDREISCHCPFHPDHHPSFSIAIQTGLWICFQCGESGTLDMLVTKVGGKTSTSTYLQEVRRKAQTITLPEPKKEPEPPPVTPAIIRAQYESFKWPPPWALDERMISLDMAQEYGVRWSHGWVIPVCDPTTDELWGWQWKQGDYVRNEPKGVPKSKTLFGITVQRYRCVTRAAIVESPLDVVRLAMVGVPALATYGAYVSKIQIRLAVEMLDRAWLALDGDEEGQRQTAKLLPHLRRMMPTKVIKYPGGTKDPGDLSDAEVKELFQ